MTRLEALNELSQVEAALKDIRAVRNADGTFTDPLVQVSLDKNNARYTQLNGILRDLAIEEEQRKMEVERELQTRDRNPTTKEDSSLTYESSFWRWATQNPERPNLTVDEKRMLETRGTSILVTSTDSLGGYTVPQQFSNTLETMMKFYGGWSAFGDMPDTVGGTLKYPSLDDTASTGNIPGQGTASTVLLSLIHI
jgi:HK97 family phage major capsid protein